MLAKQSYGTGLGENTYGMPGQPKPPPPKQAAGQQQNQQNMTAMGWPQAPQQTPMAAYKPGQAQSTPSQSQGSPYQAYAAGNSQQNDARWGAGNWAYSQAPAPGGRQQQTQTYGDPRGAYAGADPSQRPPAFQMSPATTPWGQSNDPYADREAFVNQLNDQRAQRQVAFNNGGPTPPPTWGGNPALNPQVAMANAGFGGAPQSYEDSLIGRLNGQFGGQPSNLSYRPYPTSYGQPEFQEPTFPQVPGFQDYYAQDPGVPDERAPRPAPVTYAPPAAPPSQPRPSPAPRAATRPLGSLRSSPRSSQQMIADTQSVVRDTRNPMQRHLASMGAGRPAASASSQSSNQRWLNSLTPDNRRIYQMMQRY